MDKLACAANNEAVTPEHDRSVTPAQAGVQGVYTAQNHFLDSGLRRNDGYTGASIRGKPRKKNHHQNCQRG
jgi:hypothetical protein